MAAPKVITTPTTYEVFNLFNPLFIKTTNKFLIDPNTSPPKVTPLRPDGTQFTGFPSISDGAANEVRKFAGVSTVDQNGNVVPPPTTSAPTGNQRTSTQGTSTVTIKDPLVGEKLRYPKDLNTTSSGKQTYLKIKSYDFSQVQNTKEIYGVAKGIGAFLGDLVTNVTGSGPTQVYPNDEILLYVPPNINVSYGANWGEASLGAIPTSSANKEGLEKLINDFAQGAGTAFSQSSLDAAAAKLQNVPGFGATGTDLLGLATGLIFNKNEFSTFNNMQLRSFTYSFLFVARSKLEKEEINKIINVFKIGMHPFSTSLGSGDIKDRNSENTAKLDQVPRPPVLKYPKLWTIEYCIGDSNNKFIPRTKFCSITNLSLNYTPNSVFTTLSDGQVPAIQMDISFKELTPLTGDQIENSDILNGVGKNAAIPFVEVGVNGDYTFKGKGAF